MRQRGMRLAWPLLGLFVFVAATALPCYTAGPDVDQGWSQALTQLTDLRYGVDIHFPYGPLHGLVTCAYDPQRFREKYFLELLGKGAMTLLVVRLARRMPPLVGGLWLGGLGVVLLALPLHAEFAILAGAAALIVPLLKDRVPVFDIVIAAVCLAAISLSKFTACPFSILGLAILSFRCASWHKLLPLSLYAFALAVFFTLGGQRVGDLPEFLHSGFTYSTAYGAMALGGPGREVQLALGLLALLAAALWPPRKTTWPVAAVIVLIAGLYWKSGFTRHDSHALGFFAVMLFLPAMAGLISPRRGLLVLTAALAGVGFGEVLVRCRLVEPALGGSPIDRWSSRARQLLTPGEVFSQQAALRAALAAEHDLPNIRGIVGDEAIDVFTDCQGVALLNGLKLVPRPTLQSVNAVRPDWLERNAAILRGEHAPRFLLVQWISFDRRYPTMTDGPALLAMRERYDVRLKEKGYLLLERRTTPRIFLRGQPVEREAAIDEVIELPPLPVGEFRTLTVNVKLTGLGEARAAAYRPPVLFFLVRDDAGRWHDFRLVAPMARCEFLLDPLCQGNTDLMAFFESGQGRRITAMKLHVMKGELNFVRHSFTFRLQQYRASP